jgi:hypothetical protein
MSDTVPPKIRPRIGFSKIKKISPRPQSKNPNAVLYCIGTKDE